MLKKDLKRKLNAFDSLYWGCVRPLYVEMLSSFCREVFLRKKQTFFEELLKQYKRILKNKKFIFSRAVKKYFEQYTFKFFKKRISKFRKLGYIITFKNNRFYFTYKNNTDCFVVLSTKTLNTVGLTELYENKNKIFHFVTLTSPLSEFYLDLLSLINRPLVYVFRDVVHEFDSVYLHEKQHVHDDILSLVSNKTRANDAYYKHLQESSTYHFNRYVEHPAELLANIQQIVYYLHYIRPNGTIDATRLLKFFIRYKEYKYACSFKRVEVNKFSVLFARGKRHDKQWYRLLLRLINFKYYQHYRHTILCNVDQCILNLESILAIKRRNNVIKNETL